VSAGKNAVDSVEFVAWWVNEFGSGRTDKTYWGFGGFDVLEGRAGLGLERGDGLSSAKRVTDDAEVREGVDGPGPAESLLECAGRNPSATMPAMANSYSSSPLSTDILTDVLVDTLLSRSPALLPVGSMVGSFGSVGRERWRYRRTPTLQ
jgi:hypothetical protein